MADKVDWGAYSLSDVVDNDSTVRIPVVHWSQGLVSFLASGIPYLELDRCAFVQRNGLCQEGRADR